MGKELHNKCVKVVIMMTFLVNVEKMVWDGMLTVNKNNIKEKGL